MEVWKVGIRDVNFTCRSLEMEESTGTWPFPSVQKDAHSNCQPGVLRWSTRAEFLIWELTGTTWDHRAFSEGNQPCLEMSLRCCQEELFLKNSNLLFPHLKCMVLDLNLPDAYLDVYIFISIFWNKSIKLKIHALWSNDHEVLTCVFSGLKSLHMITNEKSTALTQQ